MKNEFVPYDIALALKELDFDEGCFARFSPDGEFEMYRQDVFNNPYTYKNCYPSQTLAPLYQQAFRWFREERNLEVEFSLRAVMEDPDYYLRKLIEILKLKEDDI